MLNRFNVVIVKFTFTVLLTILVSKIDALNQPLTGNDTSFTAATMMVTDNDDYTTMMGTGDDDSITVMMETETSDSTIISVTVTNVSITTVALSNSTKTVTPTVASNTTKTSNITLTTTGHGIALYPSNLLSFVSISLFLIL